jgi:hypothetical protein
VEYRGYNGTMHVSERSLTIVRDGMVARASFGKERTDRTIPLSCLVGVRLAPASMAVNGFLQLQLYGVSPAELTITAAARFPDAVVFTYKRRKEFEELHAWLQVVVKRNCEEGLLTATPEELLRVHLEAAARGGHPVGTMADVKAQYAGQMAGVRRDHAEKLAALGKVSVEGALFVGESHDDGRNSIVALYPDRIERTKPKKLTAIRNAHQDVEMTPVRSVTSVQAKKDGLLNTKVTVFASGNTIELRFAHDEAVQFKAELQRLLLSTAAPLIPAPASPDFTEQLTKLADLRDRGVLTEAEFAAQKARVLGV